VTEAAPLRLLLTTDAVGGVWQYAADLAVALLPHGVEPIIANLGPPADAGQRALLPETVVVHETGLALDWLAPDAGAVLAAGRGVAALAGELGADLVQLAMPALAAEAHYPAPVVAVTHSCLASWWDAVEGTPLPADFAWRRDLAAAGLAAADVVVAPSAAHAEATRRLYALQKSPQVVYNGRAAAGLPPAALHDFAFTAGRLWDRAKNLATLDRAAARLPFPVKAAGPISGPNGERLRFEHLVAMGNCAPDRIARCMAARPVFVSTTRYEPFGLAVLEAAQAGCALVLSDIATFRELWDGAALFVNPEDASAVADALEALVGDTQRRLRLGTAARGRAGRFTPAATAAGMAAIYRSLLTGRLAGGRAAA
jgi:glycosyltransferase involved in cell wall biosynthesis